jgi:hypothetical protein
VGIYVGRRWLRLRFTRRRGFRVGAGPRWRRRWGGAGGSGWSSGWGPFSVYAPDRGRRRGRRR